MHFFELWWCIKVIFNAGMSFFTERIYCLFFLSSLRCSTLCIVPLPPITKTIQVRRTGHCWRSRDELVSDVLLWTPTYGRAKAGRPARKYIQQLCEDTGCSLEDLPEVINDWENWRERVRDIRARGMRWWWWWCIVNFLVLWFLFLSSSFVHSNNNPKYGARGVIVIVVGNGHGDTRSNPGRDWLHFTSH